MICFKTRCTGRSSAVTSTNLSCLLEDAPSITDDGIFDVKSNVRQKLSPDLYNGQGHGWHT